MLNILKSKLLIDRYILFMFVVIVGLTLFRGHEAYFGVFMQMLSGDPFPEQLVEHSVHIITSNMDVFGHSPMQNMDLIGGQDVQLSGAGAFIVSPGLFSTPYYFLSYQPEWILNRVLSELVVIAQFSMVMVGVFLATFIYRRKESHNYGIVSQLFTLVCFVVSVLLVVSVLGFGVGLARLNELSGMEEMLLIAPLHAIEGVWEPGFQYYAWALLGAFIHLASFSVFGLLVGHILKDALMAAIIMVVAVSYLFNVLFIHPITPFYFLPRLTNFFIFPIFPVHASNGSFISNLLALVIYLAVVIFLSKKIMDFWNKRSTREEEVL